MSNIQKAIYMTVLILILFALGVTLVSCDRLEEDANKINDVAGCIIADDLEYAAKEVRTHRKRIKHQISDIEQEVMDDFRKRDEAKHKDVK